MKWTSKPFHVLSVSAIALMLVVSGCGAKNNNNTAENAGDTGAGTAENTKLAAPTTPSSKLA